MAFAIICRYFGLFLLFNHFIFINSILLYIRSVIIPKENSEWSFDDAKCRIFLHLNTKGNIWFALLTISKTETIKILDWQFQPVGYEYWNIEPQKWTLKITVHIWNELKVNHHILIFNFVSLHSYSLWKFQFLECIMDM